VIPTNPAYRQRAVGLWMAAAREIGVPGFALGGVLDPSKALDFVGSLPGKAANTAKGLFNRVAGKLPGNPGGILGGTFNYVLDKAGDYIKDQAGKVWDAAKSLVGAGGDASGASGAGTTTGTLGIAGRVARMFGLSITSGYRSPAHNAAVGGVPNSLHTHGSPANPGAVDLVGPRMQEARAWAGSHLSLKELLVHDVGSGLHLHLGFFKKGGKTKGKKAPKPTLGRKENRGIKRSVARGETGISTFENSIQGLEREYGQMDRRFGLSDEVFIIENADGSTTVDQAAVNARVGELSALIAKREEIKRKIEAYRRAIARLIRTLKDAIAKLKKALKAATGKSRGKERAGYRQAISTYEARIGELRGTHTDLAFDVEDQRIDLDELTQERATVASSTGTPAPPADAAAGDPGVAAADATADAPADAAPAPATAEDIAALAAAQLATFNQGRQDLFSTFGSTMEGARALAAGGLFGDTERRAAGVRAFGAFGTETLAPAGAEAGSQIVIHQRFDAPPPDPHVWAQGVRFEIEGAIG
jgi:hypothetical protein